MKIHEYQGKELLRKYGVPVPRGIVARSPEEAYHAAKELGGDLVVVKAQIHAGGRGKGGGVKLARSAEEAQSIARQMLGMKLVTHQTGPEGREVRVLLVEEGLPIDKEFYLGIVLDRTTGRQVFMASQAGGMDIEEVAATTPEKILKETIDPAVGFQPFQARKLAFGLGLPGPLVNQAVKFMQSLYTAYEPMEIEASKFDLNYIKLDGNIACMVNGAGLAMATMDIIKLAGGEPANFLDVGGGASQERVEAAFRILLADQNVRAVLINIFGGIVRCDMVARGVVGAAQNLGVKVPVVVRLEGTNVEEGQRVIRDSGLNFTVASGMKDAAEKVVALAG